MAIEIITIHWDSRSTHLVHQIYKDECFMNWTPTIPQMHLGNSCLLFAIYLHLLRFVSLFLVRLFWFKLYRKFLVVRTLDAVYTQIRLQNSNVGCSNQTVQLSSVVQDSWRCSIVCSIFYLAFFGSVFFILRYAHWNRCAIIDVLC